MKAVFDTNIIIDYLNGLHEAKEEMNRYDEKLISIITYAETLVGVMSLPQYESVKNFLLSFQVIDVSKHTADLAVKLRHKYKLKMPDALILATAEQTSSILVTRNTKDFTSKIPLVRVPYEVKSPLKALMEN